MFKLYRVLDKTANREKLGLPPSPNGYKYSKTHYILQELGGRIGNEVVAGVSEAIEKEKAS